MKKLPVSRQLEATQVATDFYQLVGQPLDVKDFIQNMGVGGKGDRGYCNPSAGLIVFTPGGFGTRNFLFHEMGHFTDGKDSRTSDLANDFVRRRGKGDLKLMNDFSPGYGEDEMYQPDDFTHPYVGQTYRYSTEKNRFYEVMSMGLEHFSSPEALAYIANKDPEHLDIVLDYIRKQYEDKSTSKEDRERSRFKARKELQKDLEKSLKLK